MMLPNKSGAMLPKGPGSHNLSHPIVDGGGNWKVQACAEELWLDGWRERFPADSKLVVRLPSPYMV